MTGALSPQHEPYLAPLRALAEDLADLEPTIEPPHHGLGVPSLDFPRFWQEPFHFYIAAEDREDAHPMLVDIVAPDLDQFIRLDLSDPTSAASKVREFLAAQTTE